MCFLEFADEAPAYFEFPEPYRMEFPKEFLKSYYFETLLIGDSVKQLGYCSGNTYRVYPNRKCRVGDMCVFECLSSKCLHNEHKDFFKKLVKVRDNCYWFEGNPDPWTIGSKSYISWDSREYGWLCGEELKIDGRVL